MVVYMCFLVCLFRFLVCLVFFIVIYIESLFPVVYFSVLSLCRVSGLIYFFSQYCVSSLRSCFHLVVCCFTLAVSVSCALCLSLFPLFHFAFHCIELFSLHVASSMIVPLCIYCLGLPLITCWSLLMPGIESQD